MSAEKGELLPCPFCGSPAELERYETPAGDWAWSVCCIDRQSDADAPVATEMTCYAFQSSTRFDTAVEAAAAWNHRALLAKG